MKVFAYSKKAGSQKLATINNVISVTEIKETHTIKIVTNDGTAFYFDTNLLKTTAYQN